MFAGGVHGRYEVTAEPGLHYVSAHSWLGRYVCQKPQIMFRDDQNLRLGQALVDASGNLQSVQFRH